jgi:predicted  nucleic acid-binding Zn-ribbon protein
MRLNKNLVETGKFIAELERKIKRLEKENQELREKNKAREFLEDVKTLLKRYEL